MKQTLFIIINYLLFIINWGSASAQLKWINVDKEYHPLPKSVHVFKSNDSLDGKPNIAYYLIADLKDKQLIYDVDTTLGRRLTPNQFFRKCIDESRPNRLLDDCLPLPVVVVNCTFFSFQTNQNLNLVIKDGKLVGYNIHAIPGRGKDTLTYRKVFPSAIGISKKRKADIAWTFTDSSRLTAAATQQPLIPLRDSFHRHSFDYELLSRATFKQWQMQTAVGGGPVLLQNGKIDIANNHELKFAGKAIDDKHPRTAMGYTKDNKLIILVVQGRFPGIAEGATLTQAARILQDLYCYEALNLDGGGSSCMLINGKETIKPSDPTGQRAVPAVFLIKKR